MNLRESINALLVLPNSDLNTNELALIYWSIILKIQQPLLFALKTLWNSMASWIIFIKTSIERAYLMLPVCYEHWICRNVLQVSLILKLQFVTSSEWKWSGHSFRQWSITKLLNYFYSWFHQVCFVRLLICQLFIVLNRNQIYGISPTSLGREFGFHSGRFHFFYGFLWKVLYVGVAACSARCMSYSWLCLIFMPIYSVISK